MILKEFSLNPVAVEIENDLFKIVLKAKNKSIVSIELLDLNLYDSENNMVKKSSEDIPSLISPFSNKYLTIFFENKDFKSVEVVLKTLLIKKKFKNSLNS